MKTIIINQYKAFVKDSTTNIVVDKNEDEYLYNMIVKYSQDPDMTSDDIFDKIVSIIDDGNLTYEFNKTAILPSGFKLENDKLYYNSIVLSGNFVERFLLSNKENMYRIEKFINKLAEVDSRMVFEMICGFLEANPDIMFDDDGDLLLWKYIDKNFQACHQNLDGTYNMHEAGVAIEMRRDDVERDGNITCSTGLHVCAKSYLPHYGNGSGIVCECKVDVRDIVSIPYDYNNAKIRCCKYTPMNFYKSVDGTMESFEKQIVEREESHNDVTIDDILKDSVNNRIYTMNEYIDIVVEFLAKTKRKNVTIRTLQQSIKAFKGLGVKRIYQLLRKMGKYVTIVDSGESYSNIKVEIVF